MAAKTWWFVVYPAAEHPGNAFPAHAQIVSAQEGSAAYQAWVANGAYTIGGGAWQVDAGPFPSQTQAQQWAPHPLSVSDWVGAAISGVLIGAGGQQPGPAVAEGAAAADPLAGIAGALGAFFGALTDGKLWRSLGWVVLGIVLMLIGVALWIGPSAARRSPIGIAASQLG